MSDPIIVRPGPTKVSRNWRLTPEAFNNYRDHLTRAITEYEAGRETAFAVPDGMSPNTFVARFRDARQALLLFGYDALLQQRLIALGDVAISMDPDGKRVWFRARHSAGREIKPTIEQIKRPIDRSEQVQDLPAEDELHAICFLIHRGQMSGPRFFRGQVATALKSDIESQFDVAFAFDAQTNTTTLL